MRDMRKMILAILAFALVGCVPSKRVYRVEFKDGSYEYYELDYRPKDGAKSIEYDGQTILGVEKIEQYK